MAKQVKKSTNVKLSDVKKRAKSLHEKNVYELEDGSTITHYIQFPDLLIEEMLEELQRHYITMANKEINLSEKMNFYFINFLMIKHFTHFKNDMPGQLLTVDKKAGLLEWLDHFVDTGLLKTIVDEVFLKDQVMKVYDKMTDFLGATKVIEELGIKAQEKFNNLKLQNSDVFEQLSKVGTENKDVH